MNNELPTGRPKMKADNEGKVGDVTSLRSEQGNLPSHTPGPWHWEVHDFSMASICGPRGEEDHVLSVSPCENCQEGATEWEFGRCTTPSEADARRIVACVNACEGLTEEVLAEGWMQNSITLLDERGTEVNIMTDRALAPDMHWWLLAQEVAAMKGGASLSPEVYGEALGRCMGKTRVDWYADADALLRERDALKALNAELVASLSECLPWAQEYADEWNDENRVPMPSKQLARLERARTVLAKAKP